MPEIIELACFERAIVVVEVHVVLHTAGVLTRVLLHHVASRPCSHEAAMPW